MAVCAHCGSNDVQAGLDRMQCLTCGKHSDFEGNTAEGGFNQDTKDALLERVNRVPSNPVGNYADLQRAGGKILAGQAASFSEGVEPPPNRTVEEIQETSAAADEIEAAAAEAAEKVDKANAKAEKAKK